MNELKLNLQFFAEDSEGDSTSQEGNKTFTQDEVNRIVSDRLNREKGKINEEREATYSKREEELIKREFLLKAREILSEENLPSELIGALNCMDEEAFLKSIDTIKKYISPTENKTQETRYKMVYTPNAGSVSIPDPVRKAMGLK